MILRPIRKGMASASMSRSVSVVSPGPCRSGRTRARSSRAVRLVATLRLASDPFTRVQLGLFCVTTGEKGDAELRRADRLLCSSGRSRRRALEQVHRRGHVAPLQGADSCLTEPADRRPRPVFPRRGPRRRARSGADRPARGGSRRIRRARRDPAQSVETVGEALVQLRAKPLRRRAVDGLLDDDVAEAERVLFGRPEEAARDERLEVRGDGWSGIGVEERCQVVLRESSEHDRTALEDGSLPRARAGRDALPAAPARSRARSARPDLLRARARAAARRRTGSLRPSRRYAPADPTRGSRRRARRRGHRCPRPRAYRAPMRSTFSRSSRNDGLSSSSSSLARQTTRIRPWPRSASSSMSSRKVGSAQWTSSKTRTSGLSRRERLAELPEDPCDLGRRRRCVRVERARVSRPAPRPPRPAARPREAAST